MVTRVFTCKFEALAERLAMSKHPNSTLLDFGFNKHARPDITCSAETVVDEFACLRPRRLELINPFI